MPLFTCFQFGLISDIAVTRFGFFFPFFLRTSRYLDRQYNLIAAVDKQMLQITGMFSLYFGSLSPLVDVVVLKKILRNPVLKFVSCQQFLSVRIILPFFA